MLLFHSLLLSSSLSPHCVFMCVCVCLRGCVRVSLCLCLCGVPTPTRLDVHVYLASGYKVLARCGFAFLMIVGTVFVILTVLSTGTSIVEPAPAAAAAAFTPCVPSLLLMAA